LELGSIDGVRVEVLGPVRAWRGRTELKLGARRQRTVFAILAMRAGRAVSGAELVSAVWGQRAPMSAAGSVHTYVSGLRRVLEPERARWAAGAVLTSSPAGYTLHVDPGAVDATAFGRLVDQARREGSGMTPSDTVATLDRALALWQGDPLSGLPGPALDQERDRLGELRVAAVELRAESLLAPSLRAERTEVPVGELTGELIAELTALTREYPLRERLRELLMLALYRDGRRVEALEVFRDVHTALVTELGIEPGAGLRRLRSRILAQDLALDATSGRSGGADGRPTARTAGRLSVLPAQVARRLESGARSPFVGRDVELGRLRSLVDDVCQGRGGCAWIDGDPGIGKSELLVTALSDVRDRGCQLGWTAADELSARIPLRVINDCLGIGGTIGSASLVAPAVDPHQARSTPTMSGPSGWEGDETASVTVGRILRQVDELCAVGPLVLVVDDMQWADEASVLLWQRLVAVTRRSPLLLITAARPILRTTALVRLRQAVEQRGWDVLSLGPLSAAESLALHESLLDAQAGPDLRDLVERTIGNPLYVIELTEALVRDRALVRTAGGAELADCAGYTAPRSLVDTIGRHLDILTDGVRDMLRWAALLGTEFTVMDIATVTGKRPSDLLAVFEDAVAANVIVDTGTHLAFRHPLLRQACYDVIPAGARAALHRQLAEALVHSGAPVSRVAEQIAAARIADPWVVRWLTDHHGELASRAPLIAADLLGLGFDACPPADARREVLAAALVTVLFGLGRQPEVEARTALTIATDPVRAAQMRQLLAVLRYRAGDVDEAVAILTDATADPTVPDLWRRHHQHLLADFRRGDLTDLTDLDAARTVARDAISAAQGDDHLTVRALQTQWLVASIRREHREALEHIDEALAVVGRSDALADLALDLLDNRIFSCQNLDRLGEAEKSLNTARRIAAGHSFAHRLQLTAAAHYYWTGRWDDALFELASVAEGGPVLTFLGLRESSASGLPRHGLVALIAGSRGDTSRTAVELAVIEGYAPATHAERENVGFLLCAQSLALARDGDLDRALSVLDPVLAPGFSPMALRHQWLPWIVRTALAAGDQDRAQRAAWICDGEAAQERTPGRATVAARWCGGLVDRDPVPIMSAADQFRRAGRLVELGGALEDAAALFAERTERAAAQSAFDECIQVYTALSAHWDLHRAGDRLSAHGIHGGRGQVPPPRWHDRTSLSPVEIDVARLVAARCAGPDIAEQLGLPRRTVEAHLVRLGATPNATGRDGMLEHTA
jgi:DNA-binding SARP family transcriptional activator/DNA-binding CsgD family transcriptional regulator/tetratricopeptide (TPR) repeat protein